MRAVGLLPLCALFTLADAYVISAPRYATAAGHRRISFQPAMASTINILGAEDYSDACLVLPHEDYPGNAPAHIIGEMSLQEMEDEQETFSQIFLYADGSVAFGATDGPPPLSACGIWQCGSDGFQMTLSRNFDASPSTLDPGVEGKMSEGLTYTVTRVYLGTVNQDSTDIKAVEGRMELFSESAGREAEETRAANVITQWKGEVLSSGASTQPIGYFVLDAIKEETDDDK